MKKLAEVNEIPALALEATIPNSRSTGGSTKIKPFFRTENEMNLYKTVGKKKFNSVQLQQKLLIFCNRYK